MKPPLTRATFFSALFFLLLLTACSKTVTPPTLPIGLQTGWNQLTPAGDTICADGSDYSYFVSPGKINKLLIDFEGGGACWNGGTCSNPSTPENSFQGLYLDRVYGSPEAYGFGGIYDRTNAANPFRDWYQVHISYCTGDLHLGDNTASYAVPDGTTLEVQHRGAVNTQAALTWVYNNFSAPETVFVAGVSAGAYASLIWLPEITDHYPDAAVYQLGDSGAGVVTENFFSGDAAGWQLEGALPELDEPIALDQNILANLYAVIGRAYPDATLSQYTSLFDGTQIGFYGLMQGITQPTPELAQDWSSKMLASLSAISSETPNFRSYVSTLDVDNDAANGTAHVILQRPELYTLETGGVRFVDWLGDLANGRALENVNPSDAPPSALGDSPTISGKIANLGRGNFGKKALELKVGIFSAGPVDDVFAASPVGGDGSFSLLFPGEAEMTPRLFDGRPEVFTLPGCDTAVTPAAFKLAVAQDFGLFEDDESADTADEVLHTRTDDLNSTLVTYYYVDRDVRATGTCAGGDFAGFEIDIDMREGWNTIVFDFARARYQNEDLSAGYQWVIPSLCTINGDCPSK